MCEKKHHQECVRHYHSEHDKDDISPIHPDADDFKCQPVGNKCKKADCDDHGNGKWERGGRRPRPLNLLFEAASNLRQQPNSTTDGRFKAYLLLGETSKFS